MIMMGESIRQIRVNILLAPFSSREYEVVIGCGKEEKSVVAFVCSTDYILSVNIFIMHGVSEHQVIKTMSKNEGVMWRSLISRHLWNALVIH